MYSMIGGIFPKQRDNENDRNDEPPFQQRQLEKSNCVNECKTLLNIFCFPTSHFHFRLFILLRVRVYCVPSVLKFLSKSIRVAVI